MLIPTLISHLYVHLALDPDNDRTEHIHDAFHVRLHAINTLHGAIAFRLSLRACVLSPCRHVPCVPHWSISALDCHGQWGKCTWARFPGYLTLSRSHYSDVIMSAMASEITGVSIIYSNVCSADQRKHQSSASLAFVGGIHRWPVNSPYKGPVAQKLLPFNDVILNLSEDT